MDSTQRQEKSADYLNFLEGLEYNELANEVKAIIGYANRRRLIYLGELDKDIKALEDKVQKLQHIKNTVELFT